jgi:phosphoglucomutase
MGKDTHGLSAPAQRTALEVLAANDVETFIQRDDGVTPTPVISHAILVYNRGRKEYVADGIVITPSHNPPEDGGFKYNPPNGGPADTDVTRWVQDRANELLRKSNAAVKQVPFTMAIKAPSTHQEDYVVPYVKDLRNVVDLDAIRAAGLKLAVDPLGGASLPYWEPINSIYKLDIIIVNQKLDPTFSFMTVDHDGKISHGLLQPVRDGPARWSQGSVPGGFCERPGFRPAWDRHPVRGIDEPQPLSGGGHSLLADPSSRLGIQGCGRQNAGQQQHD